MGLSKSGDSAVPKRSGKGGLPPGMPGRPSVSKGDKKSSPKNTLPDYAKPKGPSGGGSSKPLPPYMNA